MPENPIAVPQPGSGQAAGTLLTLAGLLNILWRRKLIILLLTGLGLLAGFAYILSVDVLYRATAQVRPGITSYTDLGQPLREWRLKDVSRFFRRRFYMQSVRRQMGWSPGEGRPVIRAEFIPRGSQNIQGGNVITLQTLATSPTEAQAVLAAAMSAFVEFAAADTVSSGLHLTRQGLEIQLANLRNEKDRLETDGERVALEIVKQEAELGLIEAEQQRIEIELEKVAEDNTYRRRCVEMSEQEAEEALTSLGQVEGTLAMLKRGESGFVVQRDSLLASLGEDNLASWLLTNMFRNDAEAISNMILGGLEVRSRAYRNQARADSLRHEIKLAEFFVSNLKIKMDVELGKNRTDIRTRISDLILRRDQDLVHERIDIERQMRAKQTQLRALTPLEKIGQITATNRPVRPRKLRAIAILTFLGLMGSICLAIVWDYLSSHRDEILAGSGTRG